MDLTIIEYLLTFVRAHVALSPPIEPMTLGQLHMYAELRWQTHQSAIAGCGPPSP
jgi:hypothetical protein